MAGAEPPGAALFDELAQAENAGWARAESDILRAWSQSGSAAMDLLLKRGGAALDAGDTGAAIDHLSALIDHAPEFPEGWAQRAGAFYAHGQAGPALADLAQALRLEPRHFVALTLLGTILEDVGRPEAALRAFEASLAVHPHQQEAIDARARIRQARDGIAL